MAGDPIAVRAAHGELMDAYRETRKHSDTLAFPHDLYVRHVLARSSTGAAMRLRIHAPELAQETQQLADDFSKEDLFGRATGAIAAEARENALRYLFQPAAAFTLICGIGVGAIGVLEAIGSGSEAAGAQTYAALATGSVGAGWLLVQIVRGIVQSVETARWEMTLPVGSSAHAQRALREQLDPHEQRFFSTLGGGVPSRTLLTAIPTILTILALAYAGLILFIALSFASGFGEAANGSG